MKVCGHKVPEFFRRPGLVVKNIVMHNATGKCLLDLTVGDQHDIGVLPQPVEDDFLASFASGSHNPKVEGSKCFRNHRRSSKMDGLSDESDRRWVLSCLS